MSYLIIYTSNKQTFAKVTDNLTKEIKRIKKDGGKITRVKQVKA